jgi:hypothetical protein
MATRIIRLPAVAAVLAKQPSAKNVFAVCDGIADYATLTEPHSGHRDGSAWAGGMSGKDSVQCLRTCDLSGVKAADEYLSKIEGLLRFETKRWRNVMDVTGGAPDVPSFIAGHPLNMRRRQRQVSQQGPLAVVCDLTSSGSISAEHVRMRGCAILALVRALTNLRPVELWAVVGLGRSGLAVEILTRINTTPMDLARAAHMLTHPSVSRGLGYGYCQEAHQSGGNWNFGDISLQRKTARESFMRVIPFAADVLYVPPIYGEDKAISDPVAWLKDMLKEHGGIIEH